MAIINPGFSAPLKRHGHLPPGQSEVHSWPVLTYGPTPQVPWEAWSLAIDGAVKQPLRLTGDEFMALPRTTLTTDIHCVTRWSKLGMTWEGVSVDDLIE